MTIVVPIYNTTLSYFESVSWNRLVSTTRYDIVVVCPESISDTLRDTLGVRVIGFDDGYFTSVTSYSQLLTSDVFYETMLRIDTKITVYQLDCYIIYPDRFDDIISYYSAFEYTGAPIIATDARWNNVPAIGNGGFSVRDIGILYNIKQQLNVDIDTIDEKYRTYEDLFWAEYVSDRYYIHKPSFNDVVHNCWDMNPDVLYNMVHHLPVVAHAVPKNISFWRQYISDVDWDKV